MGIGAFFHHVFDFFKSIGHDQSWEKSALTTIKLIGPLTAQLISSAAGEPAADSFTKGVNEVQSDLALAAGVLGQAVDNNGGDVSQAVTALNAVKANLPALLAAGHVKDPAKLEKIDGLSGRIVSEVDAILSLVPQTSASASAPTAA